MRRSPLFLPHARPSSPTPPLRFYADLRPTALDSDCNSHDSRSKTAPILPAQREQRERLVARRVHQNKTSTYRIRPPTRTTRGSRWRLTCISFAPPQPPLGTPRAPYLTSFAGTGYTTLSAVHPTPTVPSITQQYAATPEGDIDFCLQTLLDRDATSLFYSQIIDRPRAKSVDMLGTAADCLYTVFALVRKICIYFARHRNQIYSNSPLIFSMHLTRFRVARFLIWHSMYQLPSF